MKARKRGRRPLGRKAMTAAQRQARHRQQVREAAQRQLAEEQPLERRLCQPPRGYGRAKELLQGPHDFERARREFGFEEGVFVDGALLATEEVMELAQLPPRERQQWLAEARKARKDFACNAVSGYMQTMRVSLKEFIRYVEEQQRQQQRWREKRHAPVARLLRRPSSPNDANYRQFRKSNHEWGG